MFDFGAIFPFTDVPAYNLPVYASQWPSPDTTQDSVRGRWLSFTAVAISDNCILCACKAQLSQNSLLSTNRNDAARNGLRSAQRMQDTVLSNGFNSASISLQHPVIPSAEGKSAQVEYLFEKALSTLGSIELPNKPSLFLVYAHDNPSYGKAEAAISRYLIDKLSQIQVNLYSDQTPMGQPSSRAAEGWKEDGKLEDILTSQLCLLPTRLRDDVGPVDKVAVCCSEVLEKYLDWPHYGEFYRELREAYHKDCEQKSTSSIRKVVKAFSQEAEYKAGFHHVLTEMAFLQIRAEQLTEQHGIIPVSLTPKSSKQCLGHFIAPTTVRVEDISRFEEQAKVGRGIYLNQGQHVVLFKLIERLFVSSNEVKPFLNKFWQGYSECTARLKDEHSTLDWFEFTKLVDRIFGDIDRELRSQLLQVLQQHKNIVEKLRLLNPSDLRKALYQHYQRSNLSIQRVSGQTVSLDNCYINLAIVESHAQREKDKKELEQQAAAFERLPSNERLEATNQNKLISVDQLFEKQKLRDGSENVPKRILIQGRAGIGKTTLCKKLVYEYYQNGLWQDRFESVLWVPLRQLKANRHERLENLLCTEYFRSHELSRAQALSRAFYTHQDKTLFILDGLDEVANDLDERNPTLRGFVQNLLTQAHVVITSRPAGVELSLLGQLDLELETVGFSLDNVQAYIQKFAPESERAAIGQFIERTPLIQGLVNIPIQLDALCYSWNDSFAKNQETITIAILYEAMVNRLWSSKDCLRLEKEDSGKLLSAKVIEGLSEEELEELISTETTYLGYLALKGLEADKLEFSVKELGQCRVEFNKSSLAKTKLPYSFITDLKKTSFLHTADAEPLEADRQYHFLHLTFQEFFAAKYLVRHLQTYAKTNGNSTLTEAAHTNLGLILSQRQLETFIVANKYNPRYEIVWWMVAGLLLKGAPLERFFTLLGQKPHAVRHYPLMAGCLNEARAQLYKTTVNKLEKELQPWICNALYQHYKYSLSIQRVSGQRLSLDNCYINLALVESQAQREKDKKELEKQAFKNERLPGSERLEAPNPNKLIALDKLFEPQKLRDGSEGIPRRILIWGRAGIGKSTLCKKLVYEYHENGLWQDRFDSVLWVPLRQLKMLALKNLEDLLCNRYFSHHEKSQAEALSKVFHFRQGKALFILDGVDEVVDELDERHPLRKFLQTLLNKAHVVITSRPARVETSLLGQLDLELETVGFSPTNVQAYIETCVPGQAAIQQFIDRTPLIQDLVNIPILLDALCYSWNDRLPQNQEVTMSMLYEAMVDKLWRKDSVRLEKKEEGKVLDIYDIECLLESELEELMAAEIDYLSYLAFKGLETQKIEFSREELSQRRQELNGSARAERKLPLNFTTNLKKTSYLHTADAHRPESERQYHFLHLTFQEFFAAKFLARHLQAYTKVERARAHVVQKGLGVMPQCNEVEAFISTYKYNPQYEIVWWMVAGLLEGVALEHFFTLLEAAPRDLIGGRHQQVIMGCLNEARTQLNKTTAGRLERELMQGLHFEFKFSEYGWSELGRQRTFPERLLLEDLNQPKAQKEKIVRTLGARSILSEKAIFALVEVLLNENEKARDAAAQALAKQSTLPTNVICILTKVLKDDNEGIRFAAARALSRKNA